MRNVREPHGTASAPSYGAFGALVAVVLLFAACAPSSVGGPPTASITSSPTPVSSCATVLPGAATIDLGSAGFVYPFASPTGTVGTLPATTISGAGFFSVHEFDACTPTTTPAALTTFYETQLPALPHGWTASATFPYDGGLMQSCATPCFFDPRGGPLYYLVLDQFVAHGAVVSYHVRWAAFPAEDFPTCGANFTSGPPAQQLVYFVPGFTPAIPVPPTSSVTQSAAAGGLRLIEVCSPGAAAFVNQFMQKYLAVTNWVIVGATGWCSADCWQNGSQVIAWSATTDPSTWHIAWHV